MSRETFGGRHGSGRKEQFGARPVGPGLLGTVSAVLRVVVIGMFLVTFALQTYRIPSASMVPTLEIGDFVLVSKFAVAAETRAGLWDRLEKRILAPAPIRRGSLLVFHFPPEPSRLLVKRVVGMPGDRLHMRNGRVFLNNVPLEEPYAIYTPGRPDVYRDEFPNLHETDPNVDPAWWLELRRTLREDGNLLIPPGRYFVLGDNRNNSEDSRYWGFVSQASVVGRPVLVYWAVPNGADAPEGGPLERLRWVAAGCGGGCGFCAELGGSQGSWAGSVTLFLACVVSRMRE